MKVHLYTKGHFSITAVTCAACPFLLALNLLGEACAQDAPLRDSDRAEIRVLIEQLVALVPTKAELDRRDASAEEYKTYNANVESLYRKIQSHGAAAIPIVFESYKAELAKPRGSNLRAIIVTHVFGTWQKELENPAMVGCLSDIVLHDPEPNIREQAVQIIWWRPEVYRDVLLKALADNDDGVSGFAGQALASWGAQMSKPDPKTVAFFMSLLKDERPFFRITAVRGVLGGKGFNEVQKKEALRLTIENLDVKERPKGPLCVRVAVEIILPHYTGQFFGKYYNDVGSQPSEAEKQLIIKRWKDWWAANRDKLRWDEKRQKFILPDEKK